jgi:hypothetical protein
MSDDLTADCGEHGWCWPRGIVCGEALVSIKTHIPGEGDQFYKFDRRDLAR